MKCVMKLTCPLLQQPDWDIQIPMYPKEAELYEQIGVVPKVDPHELRSSNLEDS